ncbi:MAG: replication-relaxation family protein [Gaiellaceae bacterium]
MRSRAVRVSAERVFELVRHLTERDRAIALALYEHQLLTTDQLTLLFFSSRRRAQDRLRFLFDERVVDRFYPPRPYGLGKPQAHWLLDEGGAILVAAALKLERKQLGWQRRDDWGSYPQLVHRLEVNRFVTDLIVATLEDGSLGVSEWWGSRSCSARLSGQERSSRPVPDTGFFLETRGGAIECYLEWDRGTETLERLGNKVALYRHAEVHEPPDRAPVNVLFVVPTQRRLRALADALAADDERRSKIRGYRFESNWLAAAVLHSELAAGGPLAPVWQSLVGSADRGRLCELPARTELAPIELTRCLGRRWRKERSGFWRALSPLGVAPGPAASEKPSPQPALEPEPEAVGIALAPPTPIERMREQLLAEARRDIDAACGRDRGRR